MSLLSRGWNSTDVIGVWAGAAGGGRDLDHDRAGRGSTPYECVWRDAVSDLSHDTSVSCDDVSACRTL